MFLLGSIFQTEPNLGAFYQIFLNSPLTRPHPRSPYGYQVLLEMFFFLSVDEVFSSKGFVEWSFCLVSFSPRVNISGGNPYPGLQMDESFITKLKGGYRMEKPKNASNSV